MTREEFYTLEFKPFMKLYIDGTDEITVMDLKSSEEGCVLWYDSNDYAHTTHYSRLFTTKCGIFAGAEFGDKFLTNDEDAPIAVYCGEKTSDNYYKFVLFNGNISDFDFFDGDDYNDEDLSVRIISKLKPDVSLDEAKSMQKEYLDCCKENEGWR